MKRQRQDETKGEEISWQDLPEELIQIIVNLYHGRGKRELVETYIQFRFLLDWMTKEKVFDIVKKVECLSHDDLTTPVLLQHCRWLTTLDLALNDVIEDEHIKGLPLTSLNLSWNSKITDEGIRHLPLTYLCLKVNMKITDEGIKGLPLNSLDIQWNKKITDEGIKGLPLNSLVIDGNNNITSECIKNLENRDVKFKLPWT